ncbi:hypothetical protein AWW66_29175 [Micromonospora rosaria]|uniref:HAF repeat-containing protein n=1 Tax=Micromonospora rosaria TaxID=47874 RepID=A0A136PJF9_9ACTN|nr:HAF repeat-containing protein [Micromonospora rosaria]KXK58539.1 hypothetical protein AWW66_29175 [Micromonospora rosaria]
MRITAHRTTSVLRRPGRLLAAVLTVVVAVTGGAAVPAHAAPAAERDRDPRPYRALHLGSPASSRSLALNDRGQVLNGTAIWQNGRFEPLSLPPEARGFFGVDINERGVVAGRVPSPVTGYYEAAVWDRGEVTLLGPASRVSDAYSINDHNTVVGFAEGLRGADDTFVWRDGVMSWVQTNDIYHGSPAFINNWEDIVVQWNSNWNPGRCVCYGARYHQGERTLLGTLGHQSFNEPADVNNRREIVGYSHTAEGVERPYLWRDGVIRDLGTLGGPSGRAVAVSDRGEVIGHADTAEGERRPFLWRDGRMFDLTTLGLRATDEVVDINIWGQIAGIRDGRAMLFSRH